MTIAEIDEHPMGSLDPDMGALVADGLRAVGVQLCTCHQEEGCEVDHQGRVRGVATDATGVLPADVVVLGLGVKPDVALARDAGIEVGAAGGITVDKRYRTSTAVAWSAGDCTEKFHRVGREAVAIPLDAPEQATASRRDQPRRWLRDLPGVVGTSATKICANRSPGPGSPKRKPPTPGSPT